MAFVSSLVVAQAAGPGDEHWDNQFGPAGANNSLNVIAALGPNIYVGALSTLAAAGNTKANGVAGFDGMNWFPLNNGLQNGAIVVGMGTDGGFLYVGGIFTNADDPSIKESARWDGTQWTNPGISGIPYVIKRNGGNLYFAGVFSSANGVVASNIVRWDGTNWHALGPGLSGPGTSGVLSLAFQGNNVYAGGEFSYAGALNATNLAYFDGSAWHAMGNPFNGGGVNALMFYGPYLYAGGSFTNASLGITNLARWDGSAWSVVPGGEPNSQVRDFATDGTNLFAGGYFTQIGGIAATGVVSFDGNTWSPLGSGLQGFQGLGAVQVNRLLWQSNQLYVVGGGLVTAGNIGAANVARWDGTSWWSLGGSTSKGINPYQLHRVNSLFPITGPSSLPQGLYAGGVFNAAGDVLVNGLGRWDGTNWNSVGGGISGVYNTSISVRAMATDGVNLYAGGYFTSAGSSGAVNVAYWDGANWWAMGSGVDYVVNAMALDNSGYLYVGGTFTNVNGSYSRGFGVWAGGNWYNFGTVEGSSGGAVNSMVFDGTNTLYIAGRFSTAGGVAATNIAYLNTSDLSWHPVGTGLNASVSTLAYANGILYAGGSFTAAGSVSASHIAKWDGSSWTTLGSGIGGGSLIVNSITTLGTDVYVTGNFTSAGGVNATNIAKWNGSTWSALGSGLWDTSHAGFVLAASGNDLFAGGTFNMAGDKPSQFIGHWNDQSNYYPVPTMRLTRSIWQTNHQFQFRVNGTVGQSYIIQASTNLTSWTSLQTNTAMFYDFVDPNSGSYHERVYRTLLGP